MAEDALPQPPFASAEQQHDAAVLGMLVFLATELMLFGGMFAVILLVRVLYRAEIVEASRQLHLWLGTGNTAILLTSSFAVAVAVRAAAVGEVRATATYFAIGAALGGTFLLVKGIEYSEEMHEGLLPIFSDPLQVAMPVARLFMDLYLVATVLHAIHVAIGVVLLAGLSIGIARGSLQLPGRAVVAENVGLYWHLVDVIWVFLYPVLYLAR